MVNTELIKPYISQTNNYNILNIVVNTEPPACGGRYWSNYNILNIVVNTELPPKAAILSLNYNILNIVVNTEPEVYC